MLAKLRRLYKQVLFNDSAFGFFINPAYIARTSLFRVFKAKAPLFNGLSVLDVGCGSKPYRLLFGMARTYLGVDTNYSGHDHKNEDIDVYYDGNQLPFPDESYESVVSFQVLEHVIDVDLFLAEINRVLVDNGIIMISFPFCWPEHEQPYDFRRLTSFGAKKLIEKHNFELMEIIKTTNSLQTIIQSLNIYLSMTLKTRFPLVNILLICFYSPILNLAGFIVSKTSRNDDLFCDLVVVAKKSTNVRPNI